MGLLQHPSGRSWRGDFHGPNVLDALSELLNSKNVEYQQERSRGHKPPPSQLVDRNVKVENMPAPLTGYLPRR